MEDPADYDDGRTLTVRELVDAIGSELPKDALGLLPTGLGPHKMTRESDLLPSDLNANETRALAWLNSNLSRVTTHISQNLDKHSVDRVLSADDLQMCEIIDNIISPIINDTDSIYLSWFIIRSGLIFEVIESNAKRRREIAEHTSQSGQPSAAIPEDRLSDNFLTIADPKQLGAMLADARNKAGLTQAQVGKKIGAHDRAIRKLEAGDGNPTLRTIIKYVEAIGGRLDARVPTDRLRKRHRSVEP